MIRIVIPEASPSLNAFAFRHWRIQHSAKKKWALMIRAALPRDIEPLKATGKRKLTIERHGKRALDPDNLIGGAKGVIIDNLRQFGLLVDDDPSMIELAAVNLVTRPREEPHTVLVLEDV